MLTTDFHEMIDKDDLKPFVIQTKAGRTYPVTHRANLWLPEAYQGTVCVAVPGQGITLLDIASIESLQFEHESAVAVATG